MSSIGTSRSILRRLVAVDMKIAVLMTCYNRVQTTLDCLRRLFAQVLPDGCSLEVWLVDDASPDKTGERVAAEFPNVHVIHGSGNLFLCKGMRLAWDSALRASPTSAYSFFLWLNDDVQLKDGAIAGLLADYEKAKGVIVGSFAVDETETSVSYGATDKLPDGHPHTGDKGMNGNLVLIPREVYEKVGPICGAYSHQYGDYDYGWQLRKKGFEYYSSSQFCGVCPQQPERYSHKLKEYGLRKRIGLLFDPKGYSLHDAFLYRYRNWGLFRGILSAGHVLFKVLSAHERQLKTQKE